jgi:hypothetical protein
MKVNIPRKIRTSCVSLVILVLVVTIIVLAVRPQGSKAATTSKPPTNTPAGAAPVASKPVVVPKPVAPAAPKRVVVPKPVAPAAPKPVVVPKPVAPVAPKPVVVPKPVAPVAPVAKPAPVPAPAPVAPPVPPVAPPPTLPPTLTVTGSYSRIMTGGTDVMGPAPANGTRCQTWANEDQVEIQNGSSAIIALATFGPGVVSLSTTSDGSSSYSCDVPYSATVPVTPIYIFTASDGVTNTDLPSLATSTMSLAQLQAKGGPTLMVANEFNG